VVIDANDGRQSGALVPEVDADMSDAPQDGDVERRTRAAFTAAAEVSLRIIREAPSVTSATPLSWPQAAAGQETFRWRPGVIGPLARAVEAGWLVATATGEPGARPGRLTGLRVAVKDVIDVAGLPTRNGTLGGRWRMPAQSAPAWQSLERQGAWCVGKAATHEMAWGVTTSSVPHPFDTERIPGGSSGGPAACVAASVADAALGTDTGGSIRIPAALCGVVGLRPTVHRIPGAGVTELAPTQDVVGPIAHDVATCGAVAEVLLGRTLADPDQPVKAVGVLTKTGPLDAVTGAAWTAVLRSLRDSGMDLVAIDNAPLRLAGAVSLLTMLVESYQAHGEAVAEDPAGFGGEARALLTLGRELTEEVSALTAARSVLRHCTASVFADAGVRAVLSPTTACIAPLRRNTSVQLAGRSTPVTAALTRFTAWASVAGLPAISAPWHRRPWPTGIQIMTGPDDEATCLSLAVLLETLSESVNEPNR
jgi:Asp-tRNA(Asn)/Glu-tRNA(Gln) amidotransferase A subunit family amidase